MGLKGFDLCLCGAWSIAEKEITRHVFFLRLVREFIGWGGRVKLLGLSNDTNLWQEYF